MFIKPIIAIALAASVAVPANATLLINGSFEAVNQFGNPADWVRDRINGPIGFVDSSLTQAIDGIRSARFRTSTTNFYTLSQDVATVIGTRYDLTYSVLNQGAANVTNSIFDVTTGPVTTSAVNTGPFGWTTFTQSFIANSTTSTIRFAGSHATTGFSNFLYLDNASLVAIVPEPASWALLIAGFSLVGAAARRRRGVGTVAA